MHSQRTSPTSFSFIQEHGYGIFPSIFSAGEIATLASELFESQLKRSRAGARHILCVPAVRRLAEDSRLLEIARAVLGPLALPFRATLFDKSPTSNWLVAWHQDTALPLAERIEAAGWGPWSIKEGVTYAHAPTEALEQVLALRVHLDDSTPANGPLRVIPKTHLGGVLTDVEIQEIASMPDATECTVETGGVIGMRPLVIHASSKSENDSPRRVIHIEYASRVEIAGNLHLAIV